jgi:hypothetical protein
MRALNVSDLIVVIPPMTARGGGVTLVVSAQGSAMRKISVAGLVIAPAYANHRDSDKNRIILFM